MRFQPGLRKRQRSCTITFRLNTDCKNRETKGYTKENKKQEKFAARKFFEARPAKIRKAN
jgi:hypothetical protein